MNTSLNNIAESILTDKPQNEAPPPTETPVPPANIQEDVKDIKQKAKKNSDKAENYFEQIENYLLSEYEFRLNEIQVELEYRHLDAEEWEVLNENNLFYRLYKAGFKGFEHIVKTILKNDFTRTKFNPIRHYFDTLKPYDPQTEPDYIEQLAGFVEVSESQKKAWKGHFKKALVRSIACGLRKIKFNKQCIVLRGKQNDGKSMFVRNLNPLGSAYFTDAFNPESKDDVKRLATCFIINIDEMADLSRRDINLIKSKMTFENVKMRLPYDAKDSDLPRIANFWATTNESEFLTDVTGNVRWVVFDVEHINHDNGGANGYAQVDINRVWAQAYHLLKSGFDFKLSESEMRESEDNNRSYQVTTSEQEYLLRYFEPATGKDGEVLLKSEIIEYIEAQHANLKINDFKLGKALRFYKFEEGSVYKSDKKMSLKGFRVKKISIESEMEQRELEKMKKEYLKARLSNAPTVSGLEAKIKALEAKLEKEELEKQQKIEDYPKTWD